MLICRSVDRESVHNISLRPTLRLGVYAARTHVRITRCAKVDLCPLPAIVSGCDAALSYNGALHRPVSTCSLEIPLANSICFKWSSQTSTGAFFEIPYWRFTAFVSFCRRALGRVEFISLVSSFAFRECGCSTHHMCALKSSPLLHQRNVDRRGFGECLEGTRECSLTICIDFIVDFMLYKEIY